MEHRKSRELLETLRQSDNQQPSGVTMRRKLNLNWKDVNERRKYHRAKMAEWRSNPANTAKQNAAFKSYCDALKDEVYAAYGGYVCQCCGETMKAFLSIDHINNDGAEHRRMVNRRKLYWWLKKHQFPNGFQVLCMNCNWGKARNGGICPHNNSDGSTTRRKPYTQASGSAGYPEKDSEIVWSSRRREAAARRFGNSDPK